MSKIIYLMRHGKTVFNVLHIVQGYNSDSPLTLKARLKGRKIAHYFINNKISFDGVFASDTLRATKTAKLVTKHKYKVIKVRNLRELKFGDLEKKHQHLTFDRLFDAPNAFKDQHGESNEEAGKRLHDTLLELIKNKNQILCVSSCAIILSFLKVYIPNEFLKIKKMNNFPNYSTIVLEVNDIKFKFIKLISFKDIS